MAALHTSGSETSLTSAMERQNELSRGGKIRKSFLKKMKSMRSSSKKKMPELGGVREDGRTVPNSSFVAEEAES